MEETKIVDQEQTKEIVSIEESVKDESVDEEIKSMEEDQEAEFNEEEEDFGEESDDDELSEFDSALEDIVKSIDTDEDDDKDFNIEDFKKSCLNSDLLGVSLVEEGYNEKTNSENEDNIDPKFKIPDESILKLIEIVNKVKNNEKINIFSELPDDIKNMINSYLAKNGLGGYSREANTARNAFAKELVYEFIDNLNSARFEQKQNDLFNNMNSVIQDINIETANKLVKLIKDYEKERDEKLQSELEKEENEDRKNQLKRVIESIADGYNLSRLVEAVPDMKAFKSIEIEKPKQRVFDLFEDKYKNSLYTINSLTELLKILNNCNKTEVKDGNLLFLLAFAKYCINNKYTPEVPEQHAFMYYTIYNIKLLEVYIYKEEYFEQYAVPFLNTINDIIAVLNEHQLKKAENNAKKN